MTRMERFARVYRPLHPRGQLLEGHWLHAPRRPAPAASRRFTLAALLALACAPGRRRT